MYYGCEQFPAVTRSAWVFMALAMWFPAVVSAQPPQPIEPPPVIRQQSVETVVRNGERTTNVKRNDEQIQIQDRGGKSITIKHTRMVDGKMVTETYEAETLADLEKKHPTAGKLFREFLGDGQLPMQPLRSRRLNGFAPGAVQPVIGDRRIRALIRGCRVEIRDRFGRQIQLRLQQPRESNPQEFSAETVEDLRSQSVEAAALYEQLAGGR